MHRKIRKTYSYAPFYRTLERLGLDERKVLKEAGIQYQYMQHWAAGEQIPTARLLARLCRVLHCRLSSIVRFLDVEYDEGLGDRPDGIDILAQGMYSYAPLNDLASVICLRYGYSNFTIYRLLDMVPEMPFKQEHRKFTKGINVSLDSIHDICRFWKCSPDWVMTVV